MIVVVGLSHRTAPVEVRERLAAGADALPVVLARLAARPELAEVMFLSTCNRVEVFALARVRRRAASTRRCGAIREELARHGGRARAATSSRRTSTTSAATRPSTHVFRVAASLDSMVLGEPQILGQVKDAYDAAVAAGALKGMLGRCVSRAFAVAKRVRTETAIGAGTVSISSVAVDLARRIFGDLGDHAVLLLGAGEMAEAAARSLGKGARALRICNRSFDRAAALAGAMHAVGRALGRARRRSSCMADVVVASTASPHVRRHARHGQARDEGAQRAHALLRRHRRAAQRRARGARDRQRLRLQRRRPREGGRARARGAPRRARAGREDRRRARSPQFLAWTRGLEVQPTVVAMRAKARAVLFAELERSLAGRLKHLAEGDRAALDADDGERGEQAAPRADDAAQGARRRGRRRARARRRPAVPLRSAGAGRRLGAARSRRARSEGEGRLPN